MSSPYIQLRDQSQEDASSNEHNSKDILQLLTWLFLALSSLMLGFRLLTRYFIKGNHNFTWEDTYIVTAYILCVAESATTLTRESKIFGMDRSVLQKEEVVDGMKFGLARDILFILCLGFSKLAVCSGVFSLSPNHTHQRIIYVLSALVVVYTVKCAFLTAFQCGRKMPWDDTAQCFDQQAFLRYEGIMSILIDTSLIVVPVSIIAPLRMAMKAKLTVILFYCSRAFVILTTGFQLYYLPRLHEYNFTLRAFPYYVCMQAVQFASISAACVIYFWPFLQSLRTGMMHANKSSFTSHYTISALVKAYPKGREASTRGLQTERSERTEYFEISSLPTTWSRQDRHHIGSSAEDLVNPPAQ